MVDAGYTRLRKNLSECFLGTKPIGETCKFGKGGGGVGRRPATTGPKANWRSTLNCCINGRYINDQSGQKEPSLSYLHLLEWGGVQGVPYFLW